MVKKGTQVIEVSSLGIEYTGVVIATIDNSIFIRWDGDDSSESCLYTLGQIQEWIAKGIFVIV